MTVQLPVAASLQRSDEICAQVEEILKNQAGVQSYNTIVGFSLLSSVMTTYNGFFFVTLEPWGDRDPEGLTADVVMAQLNYKMRELPGAVVFPFPPPAIPGVGSSGGITFMLGDLQSRGR